MRKLLLIFSLVLSFSAIHAQTYNVAAYTFHQVIVNEQESIGDKIYDFIQNANRRNLHKLQLQIKYSSSIIDSLKPYNNETAYLDAAKKLFAYYKDVSATDYVALEKLVENSNLEPSQFQAEKQKIFNSIKQKGNTVYQPFNIAQEEFCKKYGIKLE